MTDRGQTRRGESSPPASGRTLSTGPQFEGVFEVAATSRGGPNARSCHAENTVTVPLAPMEPEGVADAFAYNRALQADDIDTALAVADDAGPELHRLFLDVAARVFIPITAVDDPDGEPCAHSLLAAALGRLLLELLCHGVCLGVCRASPTPSPASPRASSPRTTDAPQEGAVHPARRADRVRASRHGSPSAGEGGLLYHRPP